MKKPEPILDDEFYHDGRGPELQRVVWKFRGQIMAGFEYFNPDDVYDDDHLRHLILEKVEAYSMASEEVHRHICASGKSRAARFRVPESSWKATFQQRHLGDCEHYQIMFYDEIFDVICRSVSAGKGKFPEKKTQQIDAEGPPIVGPRL